MIFFNWPHKYPHPNIFQERLANVDKAIESIVRSLGRRVTERKLAAALLLELSKYDRLREYIGKVQGCILLLVTTASSDDNQAGKDAAELLENLSYSDENVLQMAKANYFKHLLQRLSSGSFFNLHNFIPCINVRDFFNYHSSYFSVERYVCCNMWKYYHV